MICKFKVKIFEISDLKKVHFLRENNVKFPTQNLCGPSLVMRIHVYIFSIFLVHKFFQECSNLFNYGPIDCGNVISISATQTVCIEEKKRTFCRALSVIGPQLSMSPIALESLRISLDFIVFWSTQPFLRKSKDKMQCYQL